LNKHNGDDSPQSQSKTQISAFDCSNVIARKQTNKQTVDKIATDGK